MITFENNERYRNSTIKKIKKHQNNLNELIMLVNSNNGPIEDNVRSWLVNAYNDLSVSLIYLERE